RAAECTIGQSLLQPVMFLEGCFELRCLSVARSLLSRLGFNERESHRPEVFCAVREVLNQLLSQTCRPCRSEIFSHRADLRVPVAIERLSIFGPPQEA